jgi:hypothetical protein
MVLALVAVGPLAASAEEPTATDETSTAQQLEKLKREFDTAVKELERLQEKIATIPARMLEIAEKTPSDPAVESALLWVAQHCVNQEQQQKALELLLSHHVQSSKMAPIIPLLLQQPDGEKQVWFVLAKNKNREVQGHARLALASHLKERSDQSQFRDQQAMFAKQAEDLFAEVVAKYADIKMGDGTLADVAKPEWYELRYLTVGKVAPEIEGTDSADKPFKLSDYRGKVVLLDFWAKW